MKAKEQMSFNILVLCFTQTFKSLLKPELGYNIHIYTIINIHIQYVYIYICVCMLNMYSHMYTHIHNS